MHTIQERPVAINGRVEIRPMMYLALTYDHRLVDGGKRSPSSPRSRKSRRTRRRFCWMFRLMGQKLPPDQMELYRRTDEVLHYIWDPIGIAGTPEARDEYYGYLPTVFSLLLKGDRQAIQDYLNDVTVRRMELTPNKERLNCTVDLLLHWKEILLSNSLSSSEQS